MLIYSIVPPEVIFASEPDQTTYTDFDGGFVQLNENQQLTRLITTDLKQYLKYNPGDPYTKGQ